MKFIRLGEAQAASVRALHKSGKSHRERQRAQAVLLNARGASLEQLAFIFECDRDTVSGWLDLWQQGRLAALADAPNSGRPSTLDADTQEVVLQTVESPTPNLKAVVMDKLKKGLRVHWDTVKRLLRRTGCSYRRARRVPPKAPSQAAQAATQRALCKLHRLEAQGHCQVLYADECGFSLLPSVPYLWQKHKERLELPAHPHQKRLSVLGFWRSDNRLWNFPLRERLTAQHVIHSIETLLPQLDKNTVLVLDNAPVHRARCVQAKRAEWKKQGLRLLFLPPYCPHLNRIELLWKQLKCRWIEPQAYVTFDALCLHVSAILDNVGSKYRITFA